MIEQRLQLDTGERPFRGIGLRIGDMRALLTSLSTWIGWVPNCSSHTCAQP
jgi:hypothetical protein